MNNKLAITLIVLLAAISMAIWFWSPCDFFLWQMVSVGDLPARCI